MNQNNKSDRGIVRRSLRAAALAVGITMLAGCATTVDEANGANDHRRPELRARLSEKEQRANMEGAVAVVVTPVSNTGCAQA